MPTIDWTHIILLIAGALAQLLYSRFNGAQPPPNVKPTSPTPQLPSETELTNLLAAIIHKLVEKQKAP